jgi:hypothetical protein
MRRTIAVLMLFSAACQTRLPDVPAADQFEGLMKRDLQAYLSRHDHPDLKVEYQLLREGPTQSGPAYPKFYVWVRGFDAGRIVVEGAARVAAEDATRFEVTHFLSADEIRSSPAAIDRIFPAALKSSIVERATARVGQSTGSIHDIDFKNLEYAWPGFPNTVASTWRWLDAPPRLPIKLQNGLRRLEETGDPSPPFLQFRSVVFGDLTGDGEDDAAADLIFSTGGTASWHYLWVFTLKDGLPKPLGILQSGSRADGGLTQVQIQQHALILDFADSNRRIADCCSEGYVRVSFAWKGRHFEEQGARTYGDLK